MMKRIQFAAIAAALALPVTSNAETLYVTNNVDGVTASPATGVKWQLRVNTEEQQAYVGFNISFDGSDAGWQKQAALGYDPQATVTVPRSVAVGEVDYPIVMVNHRAFWNDKTIKNIAILDNITHLGWRMFAGATVQNVLVKGPLTNSDGTQPQMYIYETWSNSWIPFDRATALKLVIIGPGVRSYYDSAKMGMPSASNATILVPDKANANWSNLNEETVGGSNNTVVRYGDDHDFSIAMGETEMTFTVRTADALEQVLGWAPTIKSAFGMDTKVFIANRVTMPENITQSQLQSLTLTTAPWCLTFKVKTQTDLDNALAVVADDAQIAIDIEGAKQDLFIPEGRQVSVIAKSCWKVGPKQTGFVISLQ